MSASRDREARRHLARIATPSRLAMHYSKEFTGIQWVPHPWVLYVEREVLAMLQRPGREVLIVSVPPQEGKTSYFGLWLLSWYLGFNPDHLAMFIAYNTEYASTWSVKIRSFIEQYGMEAFGIGLDKSQQAQANWRTTRGFGGLLAAGIDSGITGNPGHLILVDDVIKNMGEALSPTVKGSHLREWDGSISARFQENTKVVISATRWAEDDLSGEIKARAREAEYAGIPVREIKIKAVAEPEPHELEGMTAVDLEQWRDFLGRSYGETLEGQHSRGFFIEKKGSVSPYTWACLYQGEPTNVEGTMFPPNRWQYMDPALRPRLIVKRRVWDLAASEGEGDWSVGALVGKDIDGNWYVVDIKRFRHAAAKTMEVVKGTAVSDGYGTAIRIEQEKAGAGKSVVDLYKKELQGYDVDGIKIEGQKVTRFVPYSQVEQDGKVFLPRYADGSTPDWVLPFIEEHRQQQANGTGPRNDDQIDAVAHAVIDMMGVGPVEISDPNRPIHAAEAVEAILVGHGLEVAASLPSGWPTSRSGV
jgi:predicted phage terminase large subunit-like protein